MRNLRRVAGDPVGVAMILTALLVAGARPAAGKQQQATTGPDNRFEQSWGGTPDLAAILPRDSDPWPGTWYHRDRADMTIQIEAQPRGLELSKAHLQPGNSLEHFSRIASPLVSLHCLLTI
jgi:hypothetical protein